MQKEEDTGGSKTPYREERQSKKRERKRKTEKHSHARKTKQLFNYIRLVGKYALFVQNSFFAILVVIRQKPVQKEQLVKNAIFFATRWPSLKDKR